MVEAVLKGLKALPELQGPLQASIWDQGDAVGAWVGDKLLAIVFPTAETMAQVCSSMTLLCMPCSMYMYSMYMYSMYSMYSCNCMLMR